MTEFNKARTELDELDRIITLIEATDPQDADALLARAAQFREARDALEGPMLVKMQTFQRRCTEIDPVTNQPRYGEQMRRKVDEFCKSYDGVRERSLALDTVVSEAIKAIETRRMLQQEEEREADERKRESLAEEERRRAEEAATKAKAEEEAALRVLSDNAAEARRAKQEAAEEQTRALLEARRKQAEEDARLVAAVPRGVAGVDMALTTLKAVCPTIKEYKEAVFALSLYVHNVIAHPEEAAYKRIKPENPQFKGAVGRFDGGVQCLFAAGFFIHREDDGYLSYVIEEPDFETDNKAWTAWYDAVKEVRDRLKAEVEAVKRMR